MKRVTGLVAIAAAATMLIAVGAAIGHVKKFTSEVTIAHAETPGPDHLFGDVSSSKGRCETNRGIKVFHETGVDPTTPVYTTTTDQDGHWDVTDGSFLTGEGEQFHAVATKKKLRVGDGHRHICKPATSETITTHEV